MKKIIISFITLLTLILVLSSCSDDTDNPLITNDVIVGLWELETLIIDGNIVDLTQNEQYYVGKYLFDSEGTGSAWVKFKGDPARTDHFTWELVGSTLKITIVESVTTFIATLSDGKLLLTKDNQDRGIYNKVD